MRSSSLSALVILCVSSFGAAETEAERKALKEAEAEVAAEVAARPSLGVTAEQAVIKANATAKARKIDFRFEKHKEAEDSVQYTHGDPENLVLQFVGPKGEKPFGAMLIARGDGTAKSGTNIVTAMLLTIRGVDPGITQEKANEIALRLVNEASKGGNPKADGVACRFSATMSPQIGFIFSVDPLE